MPERVFVAESAPEGWKLGKWSQKSEDTWQERKTDEPEVAYEFDVLENPCHAPGSKTVRLRMKDSGTEVLLLDRTAQIFVDGHYFGEYRGHWEIDGKPEAPAPGGATVPFPGARGSGAQVAYPPVMGGPPTGPPGAQNPMMQRGMEMQHAGAPPGAPAMGRMPSAAPPSAVPAATRNFDQNPELVDQLYKAVESAQGEAVNKLLQGGVDPNAVKEGKGSVLAIATDKKQLPIVEDLVKFSADAFLPGASGDNALVIAYKKGYKDILRVLLKSTMGSMQASMSPGVLAAHLSSSAEWFKDQDDEISSFALQELHEVTAKLIQFKTEPVDDMDIKNLSIHDDDDTSHVSAVREGAVRNAFQSLIHQEKVAKSNLREAQEAVPVAA